MVNKFLILIAKLLNWFPVLHVSSDSDFGSFNGKKPDFRISLFNLSLGQYKYYLFSIIKMDNKYTFQAGKLLNLEEICIIRDDKQIQQKVSEYSTLIKTYTDDDVTIKDKVSYNIDLLKTKISDNERRVNSSLTKLNSYRALLSAMLAGGMYLLSQILLLNENSYFSSLSYISLFLFILYSLSSFSQITYGLKVKSYVKSSFSNLKKTPNQFELAESYYTDFLSSNDEAHMAVTITKNAEKYLKRIFLMLIATWLLILASQNNLLEDQTFNKKTYNSEYVIINSKNNFQPKQLSYFFENLDSYKGNVYIIANKSTTEVEKLSNFLRDFLIETQTLKIIILESETLKDHVILLKLGD